MQSLIVQQVCWFPMCSCGSAACWVVFAIKNNLTQQMSSIQIAPPPHNQSTTLSISNWKDESTETVKREGHKQIQPRGRVDQSITFYSQRRLSRANSCQGMLNLNKLSRRAVPQHNTISWNHTPHHSLHKQKSNQIKINFKKLSVITIPKCGERKRILTIPHDKPHKNLQSQLYLQVTITITITKQNNHIVLFYIGK